MKKLFYGLLAVLIIISLTACDLDDTLDKVAGQSPSISANKDSTFNLYDTAVFKDLSFTASEIKISTGDSFFTPTDGKIFVGIKFVVENTSDKDQTISSLMLFNAYADDVKCAYSFTAVCAFGSETLDGTIAPGKKLIGWYALEVPENWKTIELNVQSSWLSNNSAKFVFNK